MPVDPDLRHAVEKAARIGMLRAGEVAGGDEALAGEQIHHHLLGAAAGFGRLASIAAPLCVPPLVDAGGTGLVFGVFAGFFALAALASLALPERRGHALEHTPAVPATIRA